MEEIPTQHPTQHRIDSTINREVHDYGWIALNTSPIPTLTVGFTLIALSTGSPYPTLNDSWEVYAE